MNSEMQTQNELIRINKEQLNQADPIFSCQLDGKGKGMSIQEKSQATVENPVWLHLDFTNPSTIDWINSTDILPEFVKEELIKPNQIAKEIRLESGILVILKGVNMDDDLQFDPVVTFRFYITNNLIISTRQKQIDTIAIIKGNLEKGIGPVDVADWLIQVSELISDQVNLSFDSVHNRIIDLEDDVLEQRIASHKDIGKIRRELIMLRRIITPQRDIFVRISAERISLIDDNDRQRLYNISAQQNHYIADIDNCLLRLSSLMDQIDSILAESTNKRIYLMTLFTLIFLPITFLTSLLGVNLSGIPFSENHHSFGGFLILIVVIAVTSIIWLKYKKWM